MNMLRRLQLVAHGEPSDVIEPKHGVSADSWPGGRSHLDGSGPGHY